MCLITASNQPSLPNHLSCEIPAHYWGLPKGLPLGIPHRLLCPHMVPRSLHPSLYLLLNGHHMPHGNKVIPVLREP